MNTFDLAMILGPLAGLLGGARAAAGRGPAVLLVGAATGLLTGLAVYPGALHLVSKFLRGNTAAVKGVSRSAMPWWVWRLLCYAMVSPFTAWFLSAIVVRWVVGSSPLS
jgi:hypothetical protein